MKNLTIPPIVRAKIFIALLLAFIVAFSMIPLTAEASGGRNYLQETKDNYPWYTGQVYYKDFVPHASHTFTPYSGIDYTEDAIKARLMGMKTNYPQGMAWSVNSIGVYCDMFAVMMQEAAFGLWSTKVIPVRSHENWDQLRIGDILGVRNRSGGGHAVIIIDINAARTVVTIAEGNYGGMVNWGRTISVATLKQNSGWNSGVQIYSRYAEDGSIIGYPDAISDAPSFLGVGTPATTPPTVTPPPTTTTPPPSATTPPSTSTPRPVPAVTGKILVMNESNHDQRVYMMSISGGAWSRSASSYSSFSTTTLNGVRVAADIGSSDITVTYRDVTSIVKPGQAVEIEGESGTATITGVAFTLTDTDGGDTPVTDADITPADGGITPDAAHPTASAQGSTVNNTGEIMVLVDGVQVIFDQQPVIQNGRTLVPIRAISEALGATVTWDADTKDIGIVRNGVHVGLTVGNDIMRVGPEQIRLDVPAQILNGRTMLPLRAVSSAFGCEVEWDGAQKIVTITTGGAPTQTAPATQAPTTPQTPAQTAPTAPATPGNGTITMAVTVKEGRSADRLWVETVRTDLDPAPAPAIHANLSENLTIGGVRAAGYAIKVVVNNGVATGVNVETANGTTFVAVGTTATVTFTP